MRKTKYRKNCGPRLVKRVKDLTTDIHKRCMTQAAEILEIYCSLDELDWAELSIVRRKAGELYQAELKNLPTKDLEDILWVHQKGKFKRALFTVENITTELTSRCVLGVT